MSLALLDLPFHVLENIVDVLKKDAVLLGCTNTYFNSIVKERIYKSIIIENKIKQNLNSIWNVSFKNYVTVFVDDIELFSNNLRLETIPYIKHVLIASQTDGTENVYLPLYNALNQSDSRIQIDNLDISNVRNFQSMTQSRLSLRAAQVAYEGDDEMCVNVDSGKLSLNPRKGLVNWNIYDIRELSDIAFDESVEEINIFIEEHTSKNHTQNQYQNLLQNGDTITENLRSIYLNLPASTLSFISLRSNAPLLIENLSVTTSHSFKNFGFKSINTKISFLQLNQSIDLSNLKSLELKINCDFHNRCEDQCIIQFLGIGNRL